MKIEEKIVKETTFYITKAEKKSLNILAEYCENCAECSKCSFKEMCSESQYTTLAGRIEQFLEVVEIED